MDSAPEITQAVQLLTVQLHCRRQALELQRCQQAAPSSCERERQAYITCGNEHAHAVTAALTQIASAKCPDEVAAYRTTRPERFPDAVMADLRDGRIDLLAFASSSTVRNFVAMVGDEPWTGRTRTKAEALRLKSVEPGLSEEEIRRRYIAFG